MKTYKAIASYITYAYVILEAENEDEAYLMAKDMDGGSFTPSHENFDWNINSIEEIKQ
jgi:hypothetical protein